MIFKRINVFLKMFNVMAKKHVLGFSNMGAANQIILKNQYKIMSKMGIYPNIEEVGFREFSQFEEDGILLYIFSLLGEGNKRVVELCCGTGDECMSANLIINHGWDGLLFEGGGKDYQKCRKFFLTHLNSRLLCPPKIVKAWITKDNVNQLIMDNGFIGEVELLSLDMDGNDYYIMDAISVISPKVIICETHSFIPMDKAVTMPYKEDFCKNKSDFYGVSTAGMVKLMKRKGYRLIAAHRYGGNCIFMRNDIGTDIFPEIEIVQIRKHRYFNELGKERWERVRDSKWIDISD